MARIEWEYNGEKYYVGEHVNNREEENEVNNIYPIVFFKKKLYRVIRNKFDKLCIVDLYNEQKKGYWVEANKVFNIIKE
jgi:hypothetical protein